MPAKRCWEVNARSREWQAFSERGAEGHGPICKEKGDQSSRNTGLSKGMRWKRGRGYAKEKGLNPAAFEDVCKTESEVVQDFGT